MAELKTQRTDADVHAFLAAVPDERRRQEGQALCALLTEVTGEAPALWGPSIVGFGQRRLRYASGRDVDWMVIGFSPRKQATTMYLPGDLQTYADLFERLGPHSIGKGCLYLKRLDAVDLGVLREIVQRSLDGSRDDPTPRT